MQVAHPAQQRAEAEMAAVAMAEDTRAAAVAQTTQKPAAPGLDISLMIPALGAPVAVVEAAAFLVMGLPTQKPRAAVYRMVERAERKMERRQALPAVDRVAVAAALEVPTAAAAAVALAECISASIFKGV